MKRILILLTIIFTTTIFSQNKTVKRNITQIETQTDSKTKKKQTKVQKVKLHALLIFGTDVSKEYENESRKRINEVCGWYGVETHEAKDWKEAVKLAPMCHFLFYHGHGVENPQTKEYGGLWFYEHIRPEDIQTQLVLKKDAIIIFHGVCGGAGSSASDVNDIGFKEAKKRVICSSNPFFKVGASTYFAVNGSFNKFFEDLFSDKTLGQIQKDHKDIFKDSGRDTVLTELVDDKKLYIFSSKPRAGFSTVTETTTKNGKSITTTKKIPIHRSYDYTIFGNENFKVSDLK